LIICSKICYALMPLLSISVVNSRGCWVTLGHSVSARTWFVRRSPLRNSYAPPVSGAELRSARVGAKLGRPVNAAVARFFFFFVWFFLSFFSSFIIFFCFFVLF
jgi:hypothetical protein